VIPVTKPYLPDRRSLDRYLGSIYETSQLTNNGPLVQELTRRLAQYLHVDPNRLVLVANGSLALQLTYKALELTGDVLTTPFSFVASASTLLWEGITPRFVDVDATSWNMNEQYISEHITSKTKAIMPVHVFGNPCRVDQIGELAKANNLSLVYDASHCFGVTVSGKSVLDYGDASTLSFHATKLFHCVEGGAVVARDAALAEKIKRLANFGINENGLIERVGVNAKLSEMHAAMGLAVLDDIDEILAARAECWEFYESQLDGLVEFQCRSAQASNNYAYFPVLLESEPQVVRLVDELKARDIHARRYFYPSLDSVECLQGESDCIESKRISCRILCLPIYPSLPQAVQIEIVNCIREVLGSS